jgi:orotidine-5'-phosphate decarboxylase
MDADAALRLAHALQPDLTWVKVGLELFTSAGPAVVRSLVAGGLKVFLDLKLHDIPNTVERAAAATARLGASLCTVHALGATSVASAVRGGNSAANPAEPRVLGILAVTVLTSHAEGELSALVGSPWTTAELASHLARHAVAAGAAGLVCSPREVAALRATLGPAPLLVVPGIRPTGAEAFDQRRTGTPAETLRAGADLLVVGRPITRAPDPRDAYRRLVDEMADAV